MLEAKSAFYRTAVLFNGPSQSTVQFVAYRFAFTYIILFHLSWNLELKKSNSSVAESWCICQFHLILILTKRFQLHFFYHCRDKEEKRENLCPFPCYSMNTKKCCSVRFFTQLKAFLDAILFSSIRKQEKASTNILLLCSFEVGKWLGLFAIISVI